MSNLVLKKHHVDIFIIQPNLVCDAMLSRYKSIINEDEMASIERRRTSSAQRDALITRGLIRSVLSRYVDNITPQDWCFDKGWNGKPCIAHSSPGADLAIEFNLSHAHNLIACAVTQSLPIGLDVEYTQRKSDTYKLAPRYFSQAEVNDLQALPYPQQALSFYDYWTLKESYIKACGDGLSIPLHHFSFDISDKKNVNISFDEARRDTPAHWHCALYDATPVHKMALSAKIEQPDVSTTIYSMNSVGEFNVCQLPLTS